MGVETRAKWRKNRSSENSARDPDVPSPNIEREVAIVNGNDDTCGGDSSPDSSFKLWKLQLVLMVDALGAALVVPLYQTYFQEISASPENYGYMRSIYSIAQVVGGLLLGIGSDTIISKKMVIIVSSIGSVTSYATIALLHFLPNPLVYLLLSRFISGLTKHSTAAGVGLIAQYVTNAQDHPAALGRIGAACAFPLIIGPSMGSTLYSLGKSLPSMVSCALLVLNVLLTLWLLPGNRVKITNEQLNRTLVINKAKQHGFLQNVRQCTRPECLSLVIFQVAYTFVSDALNPSFHLGYYKKRFQVESSVLGHVQSYKALVSLITKAVHRTMLGHMVSSMPLSVVSSNIVSTMFDCLVMESMPIEAVGSIQALSRVLISFQGVIAPIYGLSSRWHPVINAISYMALALSWKANDRIWAQHTISEKRKKQ